MIQSTTATMQREDLISTNGLQQTDNNTRRVVASHLDMNRRNIPMPAADNSGRGRQEQQRDDSYDNRDESLPQRDGREARLDGKFIDSYSCWLTISISNTAHGPRPTAHGPPLRN